MIAFGRESRAERRHWPGSHDDSAMNLTKTWVFVNMAPPA
jgi:hypothetical protein